MGKTLETDGGENKKCSPDKVKGDMMSVLQEGQASAGQQVEGKHEGGHTRDCRHGGGGEALPWTVAVFCQ